MKLIKVVTLFLLLGIFSSCSNKNNGSVNREFYQDQSLQISTSTPSNPVQLTDGENLVFRYSLNHPEDPDIADDELSEVFWFEIPNEGTTFTFLMGSGGPSLPMAYQRLCECSFDPFTITAARISGSQINSGEWRVLFEITATDGNLIYPLSDEGNYSVTNP